MINMLARLFKYSLVLLIGLSFPLATFGADEAAFDIIIENNCELSTKCASAFNCSCSGTVEGVAKAEQITAGVTTGQECYVACEKVIPGGTFAFQCVNECGQIVVSNFTPGTPEPEEAVVKKDPVIPQLNVQIPGLTEQDLANSIKVDPVTGDQQTTLMGVYINGLYRFLLGVAALVAVLMVIIAGFQWMTARGNASNVTKAKSRLENVVVGLILLLGAATIATAIDPRTVNFKALTVPYIEYEDFPPGGEDVDIVARELSGERASSFSPYVIDASRNGISAAPEAIAALENAAEYLFQTYGERIRVTDSTRDLEGQVRQLYNNCIAKRGGKCSPVTCNPVDSDVLTGPGPSGPWKLAGELAGRTDAAGIISSLVAHAEGSRCPHTSGIAFDAWCQVGGDYTVDPQCQLRVMEAMDYAGFCRLAAEAWHFELDSHKISRKCTRQNNQTTSVTVGGTTYTPSSSCAKYDYKNRKCAVSK
jgi:type IV secretory pathway VirB2 component (pilin)